MSKKVIIIGAGLAGLSAGIYLQQKGYTTEIFELAGWAGGMCTTWERGGYRFDGCIHWMVGTREGDGVRELYEEVGALAPNTPVYNAPDMIIESKGVVYKIPLTLDGFREYLKNLAPEDSVCIDKFCKDVETMANCKMAAGAPSSFSEMLKFVKDSGGFLKIAVKYRSKTVGDVIARFSNTVLRDLIGKLMSERLAAAALFMMLGTRMGGNAGYPMDGALGVIRRMEDKYLGAGGKIRLNSKVDEIVTDNGRAVGVKCRGVLHSADCVVAACDAYDTLYRMLGGKYPHPQLDDMLKNYELFSPMFIASYGLNKKLGIPPAAVHECKQGIKVASDELTYGYHIRSFDFDEAAAPGGGSSVMVLGEAPFDYWVKLRKDNISEYGNQKKQLANAVADEIEKRYPGFKSAITVVDVSTPATYARLTNAYRASYEGFLPTPKALSVSIKKRIPGLKNFYICGQWTTAGGGICTAVFDGKKIASAVAKEIK